MTFAVLKLSYNQVGDPTIAGGVAGSAFFLSDRVALTARNVLSSATFGPAQGFRHCQYWLVSRAGRVVAVREAWLRDFQAEHATAVVFPSRVEGVERVRLSPEPPRIGEAVGCQPYAAGATARLDCRWEGPGLALESADVSRSASERRGTVRALVRLRVQSAGGAMEDVPGVRADFADPGPGAAGAALVRLSSGEAAGLMVAPAPAAVGAAGPTIQVATSGGGGGAVAVAADHLRRVIVHEVIRQRAHHLWLERQQRPGHGDAHSDWHNAKVEMGFAQEVEM